MLMLCSVLYNLEHLHLCHVVATMILMIFKLRCFLAKHLYKRPVVRRHFVSHILKGKQHHRCLFCVCNFKFRYTNSIVSNLLHEKQLTLAKFTQAAEPF